MALLCAAAAGAAAPAALALDAPDGSASATTRPAAAPGGNAAGANETSILERGLDEKGGGITLLPNVSRLLRARVPLRTVDVPQADVAQVTVVSGTDIVLTARKPGTAQLFLVDEQGHSQTIDITVVSDVDAVRTQLHRLLPDSPIEVTAANGALVLRGRVPSTQAAEQALALVAPYAARVVNLLEVGGGRQVTLKVKFAEVSRSAINHLGINFGLVGSSGFGASTIGGVAQLGVASGTTPGSLVLGVPSPASNVTAFGQFTAGRTPFDVFVEALKENDLLRVLAEPNLTVLSGKQASFLAGGEFPIPVPQSSGAGGSGTAITVTYKEYGIRLAFTPVVLGDGRIRLEVAPEVSELDPTHNVSFGGFVIPALTTRTTSTTVELNEGETLSLSGLLDNRVTANRQSFPILGDLPILGALFRSVRYERDQTELVVLVTPVMSEGMRPGQVPDAPGEHWRFPSEGELFWRRDLGGPVNDPAVAPSAAAPPRFHGAYGFTPAAVEVK